jgi:hypothetical protein
VARITFHGLAEGVSPIAFTEWILSDSNGQVIPLGDTQDGSLTVEQNLGEIQGNVQLQGRSDHGGAVVTAWNGNASIASTETNEAGDYNLQLAAGSYDITISMAGYIGGRKDGVSVGAGEVVGLPDLVLIGGDTNDDESVNILDLSLIGSHFGLACAEPGWDERADVNADCLVNILDLTLAGANYGATWPVPW